MRRGKPRKPSEDSFTSVTSMSSASTISVLSVETKKKKRRFFGMGQKNTKESSKTGSLKNSPVTHKAKPGSSKDADNELGPEFVEVLNSDEETSETMKGKRGDKKEGGGKDAGFFSKVKEKLDTLIADSSSEDEYDKVEENNKEQKRKQVSDDLTKKFQSLLEKSSSDDNYDEVEGTDTPTPKRERALANWERIISKMLDIYDFHASDSDEQNMNQHVIKNWERLVSRIIGQNGRTLMYAALRDSNIAEETTSRRALDNWKRIVSTLIGETGHHQMIKALAKKARDSSSMDSDSTDSDFKTHENDKIQKMKVLANWNKLVSKLLKTQKPSMLEILQSKFHSDSDYSDSDADDNESETGSEDNVDESKGGMKKLRAIKNWHKLTSDLLHDNNEPGSSVTNALKSLSNNVEKGKISKNGIQALKNWESIVTKLLEQNPSNLLSIKEALLSKGSARALKNWEKLVSKLIGGARDDSPFKAIAGKIRDKDKDRYSDASDSERNDSESSFESSSGEEVLSKSLVAFKNWRNLVNRLLKAHEVTKPSIRGVLKAKKDELGKKIRDKSGALKYNSDSSDTSKSEEQIPKSLAALRNWRRLTDELVQRHRPSVRDMLKAKQNEMEGKLRNEKDSDSEEDSNSEEQMPKSLAALRNWRMLADKLVQRHRPSVRDMLKAKQNEMEGKLRNEKDSDSEEESNSEKQMPKSLAALINWRKLNDQLVQRHRPSVRDMLTAKKNEMEGKLRNEEDSESSEWSDSESLSGDEQMSQSLAALRNWRKLTDKLDKKNKGLSMKDRLKTKKDDLQREIKNKRAAGKGNSGSSESSGSESPFGNEQKSRSLRALKNWRTLTDKAVKNEARPSLKAKLKSKKDEVERQLRAKTGGANENKDDSEISTTDGSKDERQRTKTRTMKNWERILSKATLKTEREVPSVSDVLKGKAKTSKEKLRKQRDDPDEEIARLFPKTSSVKGDICHSCQNDWEFPILLSCSHTFCRDCITELIDRGSGSTFNCPACGAYIKLSDHDEELFCPNFIVLKKVLKKKTGKKGCLKCGKEKDATCVCEQCGELYCAECAGKHTTQTYFKDHTFKDISSVEDLKSLKKTYFCLKHRQEELRAYCLTCEISVCSKCAKKDHAGPKHDCGLIEEAAEAGRKTLKKNSKKFDENSNLESELESIEKMQKGLDKELLEMKTEISTSIESMISKLREREAQLYEDAEIKHQVINDALLERRDNITTAMQQKDNMKEFISELHKHKNEVEMLQMRSTIRSRMRELVDIETESGIVIDYDFIFNSNGRSIENEIDKHGTISVRDRGSGAQILIEAFDEEGPIDEQDYENYHQDPGERRGSENEYLEPVKSSWSPTGGRTGSDVDNRPARGKEDNDSEKGHGKSQRKHRPKKSRKNEGTNDNNNKEDLDEHVTKQQTYEFEGSRAPPYEGFTQLTSERGEHVSMLKYGVKNHKDETCDVQLKMICPDKSIVSAHVAENADGGFTFFFCPEIKRDFNCFITIGGKKFKKEYRILNFYGDFQGMRSKEIDLACRAMSLLRWHVTPGLLENKRGKIKRSKKFLKILGSKR
eukprot:Seg2058.2 transcript_id=Seg2058.2/GoldUCD/mRNA.D3Y31 product="E3 ubiquitin-protein ligase TRIM56" protein_id=Seg2058.2/GoldUCD/D3Y31